MHFLVARQVETIETMTDMGDSISRVETLLKELADFEKDSEVRISWLWYYLFLSHMYWLLF